MKNIFFLYFLMALTVSSQVKVKSTYPVYINYPTYTIKANVLNTSDKMCVNESLMYYWYASNKIMSTQGGYDGKVLMGAYTSFYLSGNLKEKGKFKKGVKNGEWVTWFENGKIKQTQNWRCGLQTGVDRAFNESGSLILRQHYKRGKLNGKEIIFENDTVRSIKKYKDGKEIIKKEKSARIKTDGSENKKKRLFNFFQLNGKNKVKKEKNSTNSQEKITTAKKENKWMEKIQSLFKRKPKTDTVKSNPENKE